MTKLTIGADIEVTRGLEGKLLIPQGYKKLSAGASIKDGDIYTYTDAPHMRNWTLARPIWGVFSESNPAGLKPSVFTVIRPKRVVKRKKSNKKTNESNKFSPRQLKAISLIFKDLCESIVSINERLENIENRLK